LLTRSEAKSLLIRQIPRQLPHQPLLMLWNVDNQLNRNLLNVNTQGFKKPIKFW